MPTPDQGAAGGFDLLRERHEVAIAADDDQGGDVIEAGEILRRVETQFDIGTVLGRSARRKQLNQFHRTLQQLIAITPEVLPIAVGAIDGDGAEGRADVYERRMACKKLYL